MTKQPPTKPTLLHIYHNGLSQRCKTILSSDKTTTLYTFIASSNHASTPHVKIYAGASTTQKVIGTIDFYGTVINLSIQGNSRIVIAQQGSMSKASHKYKSPAFDGRVLKWRKDGFWNRGDWVCEDGEGGVVARLKRSGLSISKSGTLEIAGVVGEKAVEEIVAVGVGLLELQRKLTRDSMGDVEGGSGY